MVGAVALVVIGPERLPGVARTVGRYVGKLQRYMRDLKAELNRSIEADDLKKMKAELEASARDLEQSARDLEHKIAQGAAAVASGLQSESDVDWDAEEAEYNYLKNFQPVRKNWRTKRQAIPRWYRNRHGVRTRVQSAAARVARHRPPRTR